MILQQRCKGLAFTLLVFLGVLSVSELSHGLSASFAKTDFTITAEITAQIAANSRLAQLPISFTTTQAVVHFSGTATHKQTELLIALAEAIPGVLLVDVSRVVNQEGKNLSSDALRKSLLIGLFIREGLMGPNQVIGVSIQLTTKNGIVYLSGTVPDEQTKSRALSLAESIPGVQEVHADQLVIKALQ